MEQQQTNPCQFPVGTKSEPRVCGKPVGETTEVGWDGMTTQLHLCPEHASTYNQFLAILRTVFERFEKERQESTQDDPPESVPENETNSSEESGENEEADWVCDKCGTAVPRGKPFFSLDVTIGYVDKTTSDRRDELEIVHSENLMILCGSCGNKFDWDRLGRLSKSLVGHGHLELGK